MEQSTPNAVEDTGETRAPSQTAWDQMSQEERMRAAAALPTFVPVEAYASDGDAYRKVKTGAIAALESFFQRIKRRAYVSSDLAIYYPDQPSMVSDLFVVLDVDARDRTKWIVSAEGKGPDFVLEVYASADTRREREHRIERCAALGIEELFLLDRTRRWLRGFRFAHVGARVYEPIVPEEGRLTSRVLGLDVALDGPRLRFFYGTAALPEPDETIARLGSMLNEAVLSKTEAELRAHEEARRALEAARCAEDALKLVEQSRLRADGEARRAEEEGVRTQELERRLAEALSELHKLKGWE
jgi:Uma2 family endonuclease